MILYERERLIFSKRNRFLRVRDNRIIIESHLVWMESKINSDSAKNSVLSASLLVGISIAPLSSRISSRTTSRPNISLISRIKQRALWNNYILLQTSIDLIIESLRREFRGLQPIWILPVRNWFVSSLKVDIVAQPLTIVILIHLDQCFDSIFDHRTS